MLREFNKLVEQHQKERRWRKILTPIFVKTID